MDGTLTERDSVKRDPCPVCGGSRFYTETASGEGAETITGKQIKPGERVTRCDACGANVSSARSSSAKKKKSSKRKSSSSSSSSSSRRRSSSSRKRR
jgi:hypothetical protein